MGSIVERANRTFAVSTRRPTLRKKLREPRILIAFLILLSLLTMSACVALSSDSGSEESGGKSGNETIVQQQPWCSPGGLVDTANQGGWRGAVRNEYGLCSWTCGDSVLTWEYNSSSDWKWRPYSATGGSTTAWNFGLSDLNGSGSAWDEWAIAYNSGTADLPSCKANSPN